MIAGLLLVVVVANSFVTGYLVREVKSLRRVVAHVSVEQRAISDMVTVEE